MISNRDATNMASHDPSVGVSEEPPVGRGVGLLDSEERLRAFVEALPDVAFVLDETGRYLEVLSQAPLLHLAEDQLKGRRMHEVFPKAQAERFVALIQRTIESGLPQVVEYEIESMGGRRWFEGRTSLLRTRDADHRLVVWVSRDVTKRVEADRALRTSEERFRRVFEASPLGMCLVDVQLRLGVVNARTSAMLGYEPRALLGRSLADLAHPADRPALLGLAAHLRSQEHQGLQIEQRLVRSDGTDVWVSISVSLLQEPGRGDPIGLAMLEDITARHEAEEQVHELTRHLEQRVEERTSALESANEQLERAKDAAERASQTKSLFLANMSHEIRTPLNAILGYAQLMQRSPEATATLRDHATAIARSGEHLLGIIDDVLEMSKIEAGRIAVNPVAFSLEEMLDDLERMFRLRAEAKHLTLAVVLGAEVPRFVTADEGKLRQILVNLLGNAVKFTERGGVTVRVGAEVGDGGGARLVVEVIDTGVGIPAAEAAQVFAPFEQTAAGRALKGGTGLGVPISKEFAEMMGGSLTFTSEPGVTTTFRLVVPVLLAGGGGSRSARPGLRPVALLPECMGVRVMVLDERADSTALLRGQLGSVGYAVREARTLDAALRELQAWRPRVVVAELRLSGIDAGDAIRALRAADPRIGVVAVSVGAHANDRAVALAAGADVYLRKPLRDEALLEEVGILAKVSYEYSMADDRDTIVPGLELPAPDERRMATLPPGLRADMMEATTNGDLDQLMRLISGAREVDAEVAEHLRSLAVSYEYEKLDALLKPDE